MVNSGGEKGLFKVAMRFGLRKLPPESQVKCLLIL